MRAGADERDRSDPPLLRVPAMLLGAASTLLAAGVVLVLLAFAAVTALQVWRDHDCRARFDEGAPEYEQCLQGP